MNFLLGIVLFFANFYLVIFFLLRAATVPSMLLVVSPTALARRFIRRSQDGKSTWDVNVDARNINDRLASPKVVLLTTIVAIVGFAISQQFAYLWIAGAMLLMLFGEQDRMDERTFEIWTRALAAVSDAVIVGVLFFVTIFRIQTDAFGLLTLMFFARELLLFFARRWLESEPEFEEYDGGKSGQQQRIGMFTHRKSGKQGMVGIILDEDPTTKPSDEVETSDSSEVESSDSSKVESPDSSEVESSDSITTSSNPDQKN